LVGLSGCSGSCAIYRRQAVLSIGGFVCVDASEDVNTGLLMMGKGFSVEYLPIVLSMGVSPDSLQSFFTQQYRWAMGGIELTLTNRLWGIEGLSFSRKFLFALMNSFYITNVMSVFTFPILVIIGVIYAQGVIDSYHWIGLIPVYVFSYVIRPIWAKNRGKYHIPMTFLYSYAHVIALRDFIMNNKMEWIPSNASKSKNRRFEDYSKFLILWPSLYCGSLLLFVLLHPLITINLSAALMQSSFSLIACMVGLQMDRKVYGS
jgi:cellulose synthase (UDP-forming)